MLTFENITRTGKDFAKRGRKLKRVEWPVTFANLTGDLQNRKKMCRT